MERALQNVATEPQDFAAQQLSGRNRRLLHEWSGLKRSFEHRSGIDYQILRCNAAGLPVAYLITYRMRSICGVERIEQLNEPGVANPPVFASQFCMRIDLPVNYPCIDAPAEFRFLTSDANGQAIPHPWHPNIRYFGEFAGRVCLNAPDTYSGLAWSVERIAHYLSYDRYHATQEPPYPEDFKVAEWVVKQGEPNGWIFFDQPDSTELSK